MPTVDQLLVQIDASTELLRQELQKGEAAVKKFGDTTESQLTGLSKMFSGFGKYVKQALGIFGVALSVQWAANFVKQTVLAMDALGDLAKQFNVTVEGFQRLQFAFERAGVSAAQFQNSLRQLNVRLGQLQSSGKGPLADVFERLGIDPHEVKNAEDALLRMAGAWTKAGNAQQQANLARQAFGRGGEVLAPALAQGAEKLAEEMGLATVWTENQTRAADDLVDAWGRLVNKGKALTGTLVELIALGGEFLGIDEMQSDARNAAEELDHLINKLKLLKDAREAAKTAALAAGPLALIGAPFLATAAMQAAEEQKELERLIGMYAELVTQQKTAAALAAQGITNPFAVFLGAEEPALTEAEVDLVEKWHEQMKTAEERTADTVKELNRLHRAADGLSDVDFERALASLKKFKEVTELDTFIEGLEKAAEFTAQNATELDKANERLREMTELAERMGPAWANSAEAINQQAAAVERLKKATTLDEAILVTPQRVATAEEMRKNAEDRRQRLGGMMTSPVTDAFIQGMNDAADAAEKATERQEEFADSIAATFESRGMQALLSGDISGGIRGFTADLVELIFRITVLQPLAEKLATTLKESGIGSKLISIGAKALVGGQTQLPGVQDLGSEISLMAAGGPVSANKPYVVGEEGPELFVPNMSGRILASGQAGAVIHQNFYNQVGLPAQWDAQMMAVGNQAAAAAYKAVTSRMGGRR